MCKIKIILITIFCVCLFSINASAHEETERTYLVHILNQLNALTPLIKAADHEQVKNLRITFHYHSYTDNNGKLHNGLLEDIAEIKKGIQQRLNQSSNEPRVFTHIKGDYLSDEKIYQKKVVANNSTDNLNSNIG